MRHLKSGRKLGRTNSHKRALMRNMVMSLFEFKKISTTLAKAKELRPYAETLITRAKKAYQREQAGLLQEGQTIDIHSRRVVARDISKKAILQELFDTIAPMVIDRNGGYTRIIKTGTRRGDAADTAIIELVDWSADQDGATSIKPKKKVAKKAKTIKSAVPAPAPVVVAPVEEVVVAETPAEIVEEVVVAEVQVEEVVAVEPVTETVSEVATEEVTTEEVTTEVVAETTEETPAAESTESTESTETTEEPKA
ncbi:MAG: 50S ribosomal protein L17 [Candidatus Kapaibacteriota bacterium]|jgi:large subunit ribosomal protein L17